MRAGPFVTTMCCLLLLGCGPAATPIVPAATAVPAPPTGAPSPVSPPTPAATAVPTPTPAPTGTIESAVFLPLERSGQELGLVETFQAALGDLDGDGRPDVVVTNMDRPNEVWLQRGGQFVDSGLRLGSASEMSGRPTLGDLDGDGDLDIVFGRFRGGAEIWFNRLPSDGTP